VAFAPETAANVLEGRVELTGLDSGVVQGAFAMCEQIAQRLDRSWVRVVCVLEQRGDLEQVGAYGRDPVMKHCAVGAAA
jgi:hypothetical protein